MDLFEPSQDIFKNKLDILITNFDVSSKTTK